jgi:molybdopterin-guanine dinucleotide biosynthesis protein A
MDRSAIILAESSQGAFSEDMGLLKLDNKPLLNHVVDTVKGIVSEVLRLLFSYSADISKCIEVFVK